MKKRKKLNSLTRKVSYKKVSNRLQFLKAMQKKKKNYHKGIKSTNQRNFTLIDFVAPQNFLWKGRTKRPFAQLRSFGLRLICYFK